MNRDEELAIEVYRFVFHLLDNEIDLNGMDAGKVATVTEKAFVQALKELRDEDE